MTDSIGELNSPTLLSTFNNSSLTDTFSFILPQNPYGGNGYRLLLRASDPQDCILSTDSFSIGAVQVQSFIGQTNGISQFQILNYSVLFDSGVTYQWLVTNGNVVSGQGTNAVSIQWGSAPSGVIKVVESNGMCSDTLDVSVVIGSNDIASFSISKFHLKNECVTDDLEFVNPDNVEFRYSIFDASGKMLTSGKDSPNRIDVKKMQSGLYVIKIDTELWSFKLKFIKLD